MHIEAACNCLNGDRRTQIRARADEFAALRDGWIAKNDFYYSSDIRYLQFLIPAGLRVLDLGCGTGGLLAALQPSRGVGVDLSPNMAEIARANHPSLEFIVGDIEDPETIAGIAGPFDVIVLSDTIGFLTDCEETLRGLSRLCHPETRLVIAYYNRMWEPLLKLAESVGQKMSWGRDLNWLFTDDIANLLGLAGFELVKREWRQLVPKSLFGLGGLINRFLAPLPGIRHLCLRHYLVARPLPEKPERQPSASVVVPCRNERGNIENAVKRLPEFCDDLEIIFVEGHSADATWEECLRVQGAYPTRKIKCFRQDGKGKGDAVRKGFAAAEGDILFILDADLTVPPEDIPKFYRAIVGGKGEFINGTRMVYPMEDEAMRFLNYLANWGFARIFSYLLNQRFTDTLCGTKVLSRKAYDQIVANRAYFGEFDPFGDFDLIFGAAKLNMKIAEVPIRYASRDYGSTQISRFRHGLLLLQMVVFAFFKLKALK
jgi:SAM-dependent methyltransferase